MIAAFIRNTSDIFAVPEIGIDEINQHSASRVHISWLMERSVCWSRAPPANHRVFDRLFSSKTFEGASCHVYLCSSASRYVVYVLSNDQSTMNSSKIITRFLPNLGTQITVQNVAIRMSSVLDYVHMLDSWEH